ncbi:hypothetical protein IV203_005727 [Nitzschia inconspicua]|uniref:F5/8 type C domain-containing protein n=1 Tax=Nitzschia inconspicua TaxID=303405 RepID=A0A9K3KMW2_9STRA|nr:hypothetical protein IV203_005727 [Nitzschia inconspicua]
MSIGNDNIGDVLSGVLSPLEKIGGGNDSEQRFLMQGCGFDSYHDLILLLAKIPISRDKTFPPEILTNVASFFTTARLDPSKTRALRCSSTSGQYSLDQCLVDTENSWWISATSSLRNGRGEEYVEFELGSTMVRLSAVYLNIPPMPRGPLSVRTMRIDASSNPTTDEWRQVSPVLVVENRSGWQRIELPDPVDVQYIRAVCLSNQASRFLSEHPPADFNSIGFFTIRFE